MISQPTSDLWPHFVPLWVGLNKIAPDFLLAGGYGLFLKQRWLLAKPESPILVPMERWNNTESRATKDLDVIVELSIIASPENQLRIHQLLASQNFQVVSGNERWQFQKPIALGRNVILDFHSPKPEANRSDLRADGRRVKPKLSLKQTGIHGHENREAVGCELHAFSFVLDDVQITVPNPLTWSIMKMVAVRDRLQKSRDSDQASEIRQEGEAQARKHAEDVYRVLAMMSRDESDRTSEVLAAINDTPAYQDTCSIHSEFFATGDSWVSQVVANQWISEDLDQMQAILATWFS